MNSYAVHLYFDVETTARITTIWQAIHAAGLSSEMFEGAYLPHFSLAIGDVPDIDQLEKQLAEYAQENTPFTINFSYIGIFPTNPGVVYLGLTMTPELMAYHQVFHTQFATNFVTQWAHYLPGNWVAHCTVGFKLDPALVPQVVAIIQEQAEAIINQPVQVEKIGLVQIPGSIEYCTFNLLG